LIPPPGGSPPPEEGVAIDPRRYRKLRRFVLRLVAQALFWDVLLSLPFLRWARRDPLLRWRKIARRYRGLAVEMGGVLIKLGQFLSIRVDVLPEEIAGELAGLQDEVPPAPPEAIRAQVEREYGRPLERTFEAFEPHPVGAASLAQVHRARMPGGREVVVKVLRPGIEVLVETDLQAVDLALGWLRLWKLVARRVDLGQLSHEFRRITEGELDLIAEAGAALRFSEMFADDDGVRAPRPYPELSTRRVLVMEDVGFLKLADLEVLRAAGIDPAAVARTLYGAYMEQIFVHNFVHADPHPGNLFVEPLPTAAEAAAGKLAFAPGEAVGPPRPDPEDPGDPGSGHRPFRLVFVDFGMTAVIPERLRDALQDYLIGLGARDPVRVVAAYQKAGVLLPGADTRRLEQVHEDVFERFWGVRMGEMRDVALAQASALIAEYRDVLLRMPFQLPVDLLFVSRAAGILAGLATRLDPGFDPWEFTRPYAEAAAAREAKRWIGGWEGLARQLTLWLTLPNRLDQLLSQVEQGRLSLQTTLPDATHQRLDRIERTGRRLTWVMLSSALIIASALLSAAGGDGWGDEVLGGLAALAFLWSLVRGR
jgi:predicted unusual protein kinase regulating ubiquinone biosynthesis (AarF/ABC1/UbiB family)